MHKFLGKLQLGKRTGAGRHVGSQIYGIGGLLESKMVLRSLDKKATLQRLPKMSKIEAEIKACTDDLDMVTQDPEHAKGSVVTTIDTEMKVCRRSGLYREKNSRGKPGPNQSRLTP